MNNFKTFKRMKKIVFLISIMGLLWATCLHAQEFSYEKVNQSDLYVAANYTAQVTPKTHCVSFIMTNSRNEVFLYMVQVEDQTGLATEKEIIAAARKEKDMKVWNGYSETHVLIDRFDCQQTKSLADKSVSHSNSCCFANGNYFAEKINA
jgi:hypothetical protein